MGFLAGDSGDLALDPPALLLGQCRPTRRIARRS